MTPVLLPLAQAPATSDGLGFWLITLALLSLLPFLLAVVTSFAKIVVVGGLLRQALGLQQTPPNSVITGLALLLSITIMMPVVTDCVASYRAMSADTPEDAGQAQVAANVVEAIEPNVRAFLERHADPRYVAVFESLQADLDTSHARTTQTPEAAAAREATVDMEAGPLLDVLSPDIIAQGRRDLTILAPAFLLSELTEAFQIGFLLFVPFLVIDLFIANVLLAMGMHMTSPTMISLPLKLLLFVLVDGWELVFRGLVMGYF